MSASAKQTADELRKLSVMHGNLERVTANLESASNLEGEE